MTSRAHAPAPVCGPLVGLRGASALPVGLLALLVGPLAGCAARKAAPASPAPPAMALVCRDPATGADMTPLVVGEDGAVSRAGRRLGRVHDDRVTDERGATVVAVAADGTLVTGEGLPWRLTAGDDLLLGTARVSIADDGAIAPGAGLPLACRFDGFAPARRRTAALVVAGGLLAARGLVALAVAQGLAEAYRGEAQAAGR